MAGRRGDLNEPDGKPRRWHHSWERNNDDDSSDGRGHNADTQATACAAGGRSNKAEGEVERGG